MTLGLVMIVKDEAERIGACLASVKPHISHWTILDTGSTDGTQDIVQHALAGIPGELYAEPFVDFGTSRSRAFALARGTADWLLASDADMTWEIDADIVFGLDAYTIEMGDENFSYRLPLVLRGDLPWISVGAVHEYTCLSDGTLGRRAPTDLVRVKQPGASWSEEKSRWQLSLLEPGVAAGDPRATFYAARTLLDLNEPDRARELFERRVTMGGWDEEVFCARYAAAGMEPDPDKRIIRLLEAWESRPTRLEPLYDAVHALNERGAYASAYRLASVDIEPCTDSLFVWPQVWTWGLTYELHRAAAGLGKS